jgi:hypothetical protein
MEKSEDHVFHDEEIRLKETMADRLALFDEAAPDDEDILLQIEQPVGEPRPQLVGQPRLQAPAAFGDGSASGRRSMLYLILAMVTRLRSRLHGSWSSAHALTR